MICWSWPNFANSSIYLSLTSSKVQKKRVSRPPDIRSDCIIKDSGESSEGLLHLDKFSGLKSVLSLEYIRIWRASRWQLVLISEALALSNSKIRSTIYSDSKRSLWDIIAKRMNYRDVFGISEALLNSSRSPEKFAIKLSTSGDSFWILKSNSALKTAKGSLTFTFDCLLSIAFFI